MPYPSPPWLLHAQAWLSVFRVGDNGRDDRPPGIYGVAFARYDGGTLTYQELAVGRLLHGRRRELLVSDIWVDSEESLLGARSLWAIPKQRATLRLEDRHVGPAAHTSVSAEASGSLLASAQFASLPAAALVRTPYSAVLCQPRDGSTLRTTVRGSARALPALATWDLPASGPLGFLHGRRPLVSFRLRDLRLTIG